MGIWEVLFIFSFWLLTFAIFLRLILWGPCGTILVIWHDLFWHWIGELGTVQMVLKPLQLCLVRWSHSKGCFSLHYKSSAHTVLFWVHLMLSKWGNTFSFSLKWNYMKGNTTLRKDRRGGKPFCLFFFYLLELGNRWVNCAARPKEGQLMFADVRYAVRATHKESFRSSSGAEWLWV